MYLYSFFLLQNTTDKGGSNSWPNSIAMIGQFFFLIFIFIIIVFFAYLSTRWIATAKFKKNGASNMQLIESLTVGIQSTVQLIKVGEKFFIIGVTKEKITCISEISEDSIVLDHNDKTLNVIPFEKYFNKFFSNKTSNDGGEQDE